MTQCIQCDNCKRWSFRWPDGSVPLSIWKSRQRHLRAPAGGEWRSVFLTLVGAPAAIVLDACCDGCEDDLHAAKDRWTYSPDGKK